jgi:mannose-6-phosphate isomerase-like protein (cupin superfamily)
MAESPWANMSPGDPNRRVYKIEDFAIPHDGQVKPTPMYKGDELSSAVFCMLPGQEHEPHTHPTTTHAWLIMQGTGEVLMEDGRCEAVRPGSVCIHEKTRLHGIRNTGADNLIYITISATAQQ